MHDKVCIHIHSSIANLFQPLNSCVFNYTNSIIGAGIIGLPAALDVAGFWGGIMLIIFVGLIIDWSVRNLVDCGVRKHRLDYELIMQYLFGKKGFYAVTILMFLLVYG